ncbi:MAG TPA: hypothetical protein ENO22_01555 [candidate division Zixibacteria bacterium]|nr:hypothetical protein [candidate division Zixibacteria bacterium]
MNYIQVMQMRFALLLIFIITLAFYCSDDNPSAPVEEPEGLRNLVWVESDTAEAGSRLSLDVYLENKEPLTGVVIPLEFKSDFITIDSISFADVRLELSQLSGSLVYQEDHQVLYWYYPDVDEVVDSGSGKVFSIYVWVWGNAPAEDIVIDTTTINGSSKLGFSDSAYIFMTPDFEEGILSVETF